VQRSLLCFSASRAVEEEEAQARGSSSRSKAALSARGLRSASQEHGDPGAHSLRGLWSVCRAICSSSSRSPSASLARLLSLPSSSAQAHTLALSPVDSTAPRPALPARPHDLTPPSPPHPPSTTSSRHPLDLGPPGAPRQYSLKRVGMVQTVKLVVLGDGGVGKTALTLRLALNYFGASRCPSLPGGLYSSQSAFLTGVPRSQSRCALLPSSSSFSRSLADLRPLHRPPADLRPDDRCVSFRQVSLQVCELTLRLLAEDSYRKHAIIDGQPYMLEILDTAGQGASCALLVSLATPRARTDPCICSQRSTRRCETSGSGASRSRPSLGRFLLVERVADPSSMPCRPQRRRGLPDRLLDDLARLVRPRRALPAPGRARQGQRQRARRPRRQQDRPGPRARGRDAARRGARQAPRVRIHRDERKDEGQLGGGVLHGRADECVPLSLLPHPLRVDPASDPPRRVPAVEARKGGTAAKPVRQKAKKQRKCSIL